MWAVGVIFADMLAKRPLLHSKSVKELLTKQVRKDAHIHTHVDLCLPFERFDERHSPNRNTQVALVGKPDDETIERMATANYNRQHKHFLLRMEPPTEAYDLSKLFSTPANDSEKALWAAGLDLLKKLLVFDPEKCVAYECRYEEICVMDGWMDGSTHSSPTTTLDMPTTKQAADGRRGDGAPLLRRAHQGLWAPHARGGEARRRRYARAVLWRPRPIALFHPPATKYI